MRIRRRHHEEIGFQIAPMIDITFILLIFFMVTTKLSKEKKNVEVKLPTASAAVLPKDVSGRDIINLDGAGQIYVGDKASSLKELRTYLRQRLIEYPPLRLYVRADSQTPARKIKEIMQACADAGAVEVIFGAYNNP
jgi:biopolymer transport protein ExbD